MLSINVKFVKKLSKAIAIPIIFWYNSSVEKVVILCGALEFF